MRPVVVVGDALLDRDLEGAVERVAPDAPVPVLDQQVDRARPGGAALAAALLALDGCPVVLVTALGTDGPAARLRRLLAEAGVEVVDLGLDGPTPEKIRVRSGGQSLLRLDRGGEPSPIGPAPRELDRAIGGAGAVLVADYGRGVAGLPSVRAALEARTQRTPLLWDPHRRGPAAVVGAALVTPNRSELGHLVPGPADGVGGAPDDLSAVAAGAAVLARRWGATGVAVTLGAQGAILSGGHGAPLLVPGTAVAAGDPCGAGDRFASAAAGLLADGALLSEAVVGAVAAAGAFVAAGGVAAVTSGGAADGDVADRGVADRGVADRGVADRGAADGGVADRGVAEGGVADGGVADRCAAVRSPGGTVVATGGCFDLLHAGHVALLEAARGLGDLLVVCLNSDRSVRRLKGRGRPLVPAADRVRILSALECVDAVAIFEEETPVELLATLRPHLFVKGGDYAGVVLPEAAVLGRWGGQAVVVPYLDGRSTTGLVARAAVGPR